MKVRLSSNKQVLQSVLSTTYTPYDLREFVQLCHDLALPLIRKKFALGKLSLDSVGLNESDVVYDSLADLFRRDEQGGFPQIKTYFEQNIIDADSATELELISSLRRLVFGKINNGLVRLYSEVDPTLGRILRNIKLAVERSQLFEKVNRFGEICLVPKGIERLSHLSPIPVEYLEQEFARSVLVHNTIPEMMEKIHSILTDQEEYQRLIPLVTAALLCKQIYKLGWEPEQEASLIEDRIDPIFLGKIVDRVCEKLHDQMYPTYVAKGKVREDVFSKYMSTVESILNGMYLDQHLDGSTHFEYLREFMPQITKEEYRNTHRVILEYMVNVGKGLLKKELMGYI